MPLPAALAARLAKRGIITPDKSKESVRDGNEEEVIAEDYDEHGTTDLQQNYVHNKQGGKLVTEDTKAGVLGCPNKWNVYHDCNEFCQKRWGTGRDPDPKLELKRLRMLEKYPLPASWSEVYDPGTGRYYYWNTDSEMVSWLPPGHPRASPGACAAALRLQLQMLAAQEAQAAKPAGEEADPAQEGSDEDMSDEELQRERAREREYRRDRERDRERQDRDRGDRPDRDRGERGDRGDRPDRGDRRPRDRDGKGRKRPDDLDPMDPAAYSDIPRGSWSAGLERETKSGVDSTASGPLFQQRPYPSPGAVLRANAASKSGGGGGGGGREDREDDD